MGDVMPLSNPLPAIEVFSLKQIRDERGMVMHWMRNDSPWYRSFGEVYFSVINPGVVKGWKRHKLMTQHFVVPAGEVRFVFYDDRHASSGAIQTFTAGGERYILIKVPPLIWYSFKGVAPVPSIIANCTDMPHDPAETETRELGTISIPFQWD